MSKKSSSAQCSSPSSQPSLRFPKMSASWLPYALTVMVILLCSTSVQARWCTRMITYTTVTPVVVESYCNQSYEVYCSMFSFEKCTRYETVKCMIERNDTVLQYKIIESCCPGYKLNPINNATCMSNTANSTEAVMGQEKVTPKYSVAKPFVTGFSPSLTEGKTSPITSDTRQSSLVNVASQTTVENVPATTDTGVGRSEKPDVKGNDLQGNGSIKSLAEEVHDGRVHVYNSKSSSKMFGMTNGAYAGIVCSLLFLTCVIVLVAVRLHKRNRKAKMKAEEQAVEMDTAQKMIPNAHV